MADILDEEEAIGNENLFNSRQFIKVRKTGGVNKVF